MKLRTQLRREDVFDPDWLCFCFDRAVTWFGRHVESKLQEFDKESGEFEYTLDDLLRDDDEVVDNMAELARMDALLGETRKGAT